MRLEANFKIFQRFNPDAAEKVRSAPIHGYAQCHSTNGSPNLRHPEGFTFHSLNNPEKEADLWFYEIEERDNLTALVVFGVGLGYDYDAVKNWLKEDRKRYLIFLEHDMSLLHLFLDTEKATKILRDPQVIVLAIGETAQMEPCEWRWVAQLLLNGSCFFSALRSYGKVYAAFWTRLKQAFYYYLRALVWECSFFMPEFVHSAQSNTAKNLFEISGSRSLYSLKNRFQGVPAVICGAGPSIVGDLPLLRSCRDHALIFGAGTGMNVLNEHNIFAHLGVGIDPDRASASRLMTNRAYETPYCFTLKFNHEALRWIHGTKLYFRGQDLFGIDSWFEKELGLDQWPRIDYRISTTYACLGIAHFLGCAPLILMGIDLAYTDQKKYPGHIIPHPCDRLEVSQQQLGGPHPQDSIEYVGEDGKPWMTRVDWMREAQEYSLFAIEHPDVLLINATARGLALPGIPRQTFQEVSQKWLREKMNVEERLLQGLEACGVMEYSLAEIQEKITKWIQVLEEGERWLLALADGQRKNWKAFSKTDVYTFFLQSIDQYYETFFFEDVFIQKYRSEEVSAEERRAKQIAFEQRRIQYLSAYISLVKRLYLASQQREELPPMSSHLHPVQKANSCYYYYTNGQLKSCIPFSKEGLLDGCVMLYYPDGRPKREIHFRKGVLEGRERSWDFLGQLRFEHEHRKVTSGRLLKEIKESLEKNEHSDF